VTRCLTNNRADRVPVDWTCRHDTKIGSHPSILPCLLSKAGQRKSGDSYGDSNPLRPFRFKPREKSRCRGRVELLDISTVAGKTSAVFLQLKDRIQSFTLERIWSELTHDEFLIEADAVDVEHSSTRRLRNVRAIWKWGLAG
jgi:hypothetical protein